MTHQRNCFVTRSLWTRGAVLSLVVLVAGCGGPAAPDSETVVVEVTRGPLKVSVTEGGDLVSGSAVSVVSELEGRTTILELVPEGSYVEKGDMVARLDTSEIEDELNRAENTLERSRSEVTQAEEALEIQQKQNKENVGSATTEWTLAERALTGFKKGEMPLEIRRLEGELLLSRERLQRAKDKYDASKRLFEKKYISRDELEADRLAWQQAKENVTIAELSLEHYKDWTSRDEITRLESEVELKKLALERVKQQAASELKQKKDQLDAAKRTYALDLEARDKLKTQLEKGVLRAPKAGLVVYGRERGRRGDDPVAEGTDVREGKEIIRIPDMQDMLVEVDIHESSVKQVRPGQKAVIRVDAIPNRSFPGSVEYVSLVPSSQSSWLNPNLKVYLTKVRLEKVADEVKPGMHAQVEIVIEELGNVLQVPVAAVRSSGLRTFVYVKDGDTCRLREVELGSSNARMAEIRKGLQDGELVYLRPPEDAPPVPGEDEGPAAEPEAGTPASADSPGGPESAGAGREQAADGRRPGGRGDRMDPEKRKAFQERLKNMSPEERKKLLERMRRRRSSEPERDN